jgi:hypothetical protein
MVAFLFSGLQRDVSAVGQSIADQPKLFAATVLYRDQEVGITLLEIEKKAVCMQRICLHQRICSGGGISDHAKAALIAQRWSNQPVLSSLA